MDARLPEKTVALAMEIAGKVTTLDELNGLIGTMMKIGIGSDAGNRNGCSSRTKRIEISGRTSQRE